MKSTAQGLMNQQPKAEPQQQIGHLNIYTAGALSSTANSRLNSPHSSSSPSGRGGSSLRGRPSTAAAAAAAAASQRRARSRSEDSWHSSCSSDYSLIEERPMRSSRKRKLKAKAKAKQAVAAAARASEESDDYSGEDDDGCIGEHYILQPSRKASSKRLGARSRFTNEQNAIMKAHIDTMIDRRDFYLE
jgi:hypothetical protein